MPGGTPSSRSFTLNDRMQHTSSCFTRLVHGVTTSADVRA